MNTPLLPQRTRLLLGLGLLLVAAAAGYAHWFSLQPVKTISRRISELPPSAQVVGVGDSIPSGLLSLPRLDDGRMVDLAELDPPLFITYWASWCSPCLAELKDLRDARAELASAGVTVVAIAIDARESIEPLVESLQLPFVILLADDTDIEPLSVFGPGQTAIPFSVVVGRDGRIKHLIRGALSPEAFAEFLRDAKAGF